jgi:hypothetical protein
MCVSPCDESGNGLDLDVVTAQTDTGPAAGPKAHAQLGPDSWMGLAYRGCEGARSHGQARRLLAQMLGRCWGLPLAVRSSKGTSSAFTLRPSILHFSG